MRNALTRFFIFTLLILVNTLNVVLAQEKSPLSAFRKFVDDQGNITLPDGFAENWVHLGAWAVVQDNAAKGMHSTYAPKAVVKYFQEHKEFPDGAMLVKEVRNARGAAHTTGQAYWATDVAVWFIMVRDKKNRFPNHPLWGEGWGWALYKGGDRKTQVAKEFRGECLTCHIPAKKDNWTYTYAYPVLGDFVAQLAPPEEAKVKKTSTQDANLKKRGAKVFGRCKTCHSLESGKHKLGPSLAGVFGRKAGIAPGYKYSAAMKASDVIWSAETLDKHLADVPNFIKGNRMGKVFRNGIKKSEDRVTLIEFLKDK